MSNLLCVWVRVSVLLIFLNSALCEVATADIYAHVCMCVRSSSPQCFSLISHRKEPGTDLQARKESGPYGY